MEASLKETMALRLLNALKIAPYDRPIEMAENLGWFWVEAVGRWQPDVERVRELVDRHFGAVSQRPGGDEKVIVNVRIEKYEDEKPTAAERRELRRRVEALSKPVEPKVSMTEDESKEFQARQKARRLRLDASLGLDDLYVVLGARGYVWNGKMWLEVMDDELDEQI